MLVEMTMTEQRYRAVLEVGAGVPVTEVSGRFGVARGAVHRWIGWYRDEGLDGLADRSHRPHAHPAQTSPDVEAAICELRRTHPRWGQRRIAFELGRPGCPGPIPSVSTIYRGAGPAWPGRDGAAEAPSGGLPPVGAEPT